MELIKEYRHDQPSEKRANMRLDWSRVFSGAFFMLAFGLSSLMVGHALGLSGSNVVSTTTGSGLRVISWLYSVITFVASIYAGSYSAARIGYSRAPVIHALASWAVMGVVLAAYGFAFSTTARSIIAGTGTNSANWLVVFTALIGAGMSITGASRGAQSIESIRDRHDIDETQTGMAA